MTVTTRGAAAAANADDGRVDRGGLDAAVLTVASNVDRWAATSAASRSALLERVVADLAAAGPDWVAAGCEAKGLDPDGYEGAEELLSSVGVVGRLAQELRRSLDEIAQHGRPRIPGALRHVPGGRVVAGVMPRTGYDRLLLAKQRGEVWMQPGVSPRRSPPARPPPTATPRPTGASASSSGRATWARSGRTTSCTGSSSRARWSCSRRTRSTTTWSSTGSAPCGRCSTRGCSGSFAAARPPVGTSSSTRSSTTCT